MKLKTIARAKDSKSEVKRLRREGFIPAILYKKEGLSEPLAINTNEFSSYLRQIKPGHLPTTIFTLVDVNQPERRVLIKDIQYAPTTYNVTHLDFEELVDDHKINVKVPIECTGQVGCVGIKLGGVLRQVIRHVRIRCLPGDIPSYFELNIRELGIRESKRVADLQIPNTIRLLVGLKEVVAVIVKR